MSTSDRPDQFYTGLIAAAYGPLRQMVAPAEPYEQFVRTHGEPALEIGCGHGEPILDLVAAGLDVWGLDSSADMLTLCSAEAARRGLTVQLVCAPMESMRLTQRFRSIYIAGPTFQLVVDADDASEALARIAEHLAPEGRALIPLHIPAQVPSKAFGRWREHVTDDGETLAFQANAQSYRADERRADTTMQYRRGPADQPTELVERIWSLRWYETGEFEALAERAGLAVEAVHDHGEFGCSYVLRHADAPATA